MRNLIETALSRVRRKVQIERLIKGSAMLVAYVLVASLISTYYLSSVNFSEGALLWTRALFSIGFLVLLLKFVVLPLLRPPTKLQIARFLEERYPLLSDRVTTALELDRDSSPMHLDIKKLVTDDARRSLRKVRPPRFFWPRVSKFSLTSSIVSVLVIAVAYFGGPEVYRYSLNKMAWSWVDDGKLSLYEIAVSPGDIAVGERADLEIQASLVGFESGDVRLSARYENHSQWETTRMVASLDSAAFNFIFFDIRERIEYYVEADGIVSDVFTIDVSALPRVENLRARLDFPDYTGMADSSYEVDGPVRALEGTSVSLEVRTNQPVREGLVRFNDSEDIVLTSLDSNRLQASFEIREDGFFRIYLTNSEGISSPASDEYLVEALDDQPPTIRLTRPGRDKKVTNIEEVYTELRAEDDYGISRLTLCYSVNGGPDQVARPGFRRGTRQVTTSETLYLEDMGLQPGDFVSYYAEASDAVSTNATDVYFLEVQPFSKQFSQSQSAPSGGEERDMGLAKQQKQIVVATFSLVQDKDDYTAAERKENSMTLALLQQRLQTQVNTVMERIRRRETAMADPRLQKMTEYLEAATGHMKPAEEFLAEVKPSKALPDEKSALQNLLRSEALFTEVEVAMSDSGNGGEGSLEDLVDLVDLELDRTKNQYETFQTSGQQQREEALDDALEKLKELAKRQEQKIERQKKGDQLSGESLAEEIEKLSRQLARLSRQQREPQLSKLSQELEQAAREMRRSLSSGQEGAESLGMAQQAMQRLKKAQNTLDKQRANQLRERVDGLESRARQLVQEQEEVVEEVRELDSQLRTEEIDQEFLKKHRGLLRKKGDLQVKLQELEGDLHQAARQLDSGEAAAARRLRQAGNQIRDGRLPEKMEEGLEFAARGLMNMALNREETISGELETLAENISKAKEVLGQGGTESDQERRQQALGEVGELVEKLESLRGRFGADQRAQESEGSGEEMAASAAPNDSSGSGIRGDQGSGEAEEGSGERMQAGQLKREWNQRIDDAAKLRELLKRDPELGSDMSQILRRMRQVDLDRVLGDEEEVARLKAQVIDDLLQLELEISQSLQQSGSHYFSPIDDDEVPGEFRESVEEYHRRLSAVDR